MGLALTQVTYLYEQLNADQNVSIYLTNKEETWEMLSSITIKQYNYILFLLFNQKHDKLRRVLTDIKKKHNSLDNSVI